jgi:hypothetical protein
VGAARAAAMTVAALVAGVVGMVHAPSNVYVAVAVAAAAAIGWGWRRVGATVDATSAAAFGLGAAATAVALAGESFAEALVSGFAQTHVATTHPNVTGAVALALGAASTLAARRGGALAAAVGVAAALGVVVPARWLGRRRPLAATVLALGGPLALLVAFQAVAFSPTRADAWWPRTVVVVADALGIDDATPLGGRVLQLQNPMGATGGRLINWRVTREQIGVRPFLGFGFDAGHTVYRNEALFRTSSPLAHPHHGR